MLMPLLRKMNFFIIFMLIIAMILGVSEAIWHKVVAPLSKCEKNRVIIRNELGPGRSLEYHCHSNGKDKGVQFLKFNMKKGTLNSSILYLEKRIK
ncbi:BnaCnng48030D [Brassica napus]|uniref:BnaCnng48030D protein n=1 Tax=Brassica napus TaxID=3708 RepID=A0A078JIM9_BRANA|nr:BnaCnng48030D [Brassica napus]